MDGRTGGFIEIEFANIEPLPFDITTRRQGKALESLLREFPLLLEPGRFVHPTEPSICRLMSRLISTANSIGNSFTIGSMKPLTIMLTASSFLMPRLVR